MSEAKAVVDSSGWIEVFTNGPLAELFKWVLREHSEAQAIQAVAVMQRGLVVDLDSRLAMADSIILATTDSDFQGINDVELLSRS